MNKKNVVGAVLLFLFLTVFLAAHAQILLLPHDRASNPEAFLLHEYLDIGDKEAEIVFLGDCEVYETFSPVAMWQEYGIDSRVVGTPQQLIWHSYAVLEKVLEYSEPNLIVLSVYGLVYGEPQSEAYNRMVMDALPMSDTKRELMDVALAEDESRLSYYIPLLRYHDRWSELTWGDFRTLFGKQEAVNSCGYVVKTDVVPAARALPDHEGALPPREDAFGETVLAYFDRMVTLCRERGVELLLVKAPTDSWRYPWHEEYEQKTVELAEAYGLSYYNLLDCAEEIGLDMTTDSYDGGYHLNVSGAEKTSLYFGAVLKASYKLKDTKKYYSHRHPYWEAEVERYERMKNGGLDE